jgi:hypothetical protein
MPSDKSVSPQLRFRRIFTSAQKVASVTLILFSTLAYAKESSLLTSISGLWQFEDKNVWIQIDEKGVAYQCRIGREGTVFSASGIFVSPDVTPSLSSVSV